MDPWTRKGVVIELWKLNRLEVSLSPDYIARVDPPLYEAALSFFRDWADALKMIGQDYPGES